MSIRTYLFSIASMEPIRAAVGSNDRSLVEALVARRRNKLRERYSEAEIEADAPYDSFPQLAAEMIACESPPKEEPGAWYRVIEQLAAHLGLAPDAHLPFNEGWGHYDTWRTYRAAVAGHVTQESERSLELLQNGRPLRGSSVEHDGCVFSWLTPDEVKELHRSLSPLDAGLFTDDDTDIHEDFVTSLQMIRDRGAWLFLAAH